MQEGGKEGGRGEGRVRQVKRTQEMKGRKGRREGGREGGREGSIPCAEPGDGCRPQRQRQSPFVADIQLLVLWGNR